jgi:3-isopropylmalate/(R)-2-methylmalate dehydratase large subunit
MQMSAEKPRTLFDKIWAHHVVDTLPDGTALLYIDRHLVHEVTSPQAFEGLRVAGRPVHRPDATMAVIDHNIATDETRYTGILDPESRLQVETLEHNVVEFGVPFIPLLDARQGIVHVIGPEQGLSLPGMTLVCGDSHTSTHGAMGALAFGIGTSEVEHVLATQTLLQKPAKNMRVVVDGKLPAGLYGQGHRAGHHRQDRHGRRHRPCDRVRRRGHPRAGHGRPHDGLQHEHRGRRARRHGGAGPDDLRLREGPPLRAEGRGLRSRRGVVVHPAERSGAHFDKEVSLRAEDIVPMVTWGTSPEDVAPITAWCPIPEQAADETRRAQLQRMVEYMGLTPGQKLTDLKVDVVFIGSCTNSRIEDMRAAAAIAKGRHVAEGVRAMVVPGSGLVKLQAEEEGLDRVFLDAGFEWREAGCSMCLGMNPDKLTPGQRSPAPPTATSRGGRARVGARICSRPPWPPRLRWRATWPMSATGNP